VPISPEITAIVSSNAAGKTALLHALAKLFGVSRAQRAILPPDFHFGPDSDSDNRELKDLFIDVLIRLPELADGKATPATIAPSFRHM
jgi:putative ATP-dependent endonuclease of the OLD family